MGLTALLDTLAPPLCWGCGGGVSSADPLCATCRRGLRWLGTDGGASSADPPTWAPLAYEGAAAALVRALKFRGAAGLAELMAGQIAANAPAGRLAVSGRRPSEVPAPRLSASPAPRLVPVPLHPARRRRRGFNQAERLAQALAGRTGLEVDDCLVRGGGRGTQMGRARSERATAMVGAITARRRGPRRAILVDDVTTTGATLAACAAALRSAGAREVRAVAYARTPGR